MRTTRFIIGIVTAVLLASAIEAAEPQVLGWLEGAYLQPWGIRVRAKLDTGARTSSLHADRITTFEQEGETWVRFHLPYGRREGFDQGVVIERPLLREALVKERMSESRSRYVVELDVCISGKTYTTPVSLFDRSNFNYPMILGRLMLDGNIIVDSSRTFLGTRDCHRARRKPEAVPGSVDK